MNKCLFLFALILCFKINVTAQPYAWQWVQGGTDSTNASIKSVITDASSNSYVFGNFYDTLVIGGTPVLYNNGSSDVFVAKYDAAGTLEWIRGFGGAKNENAQHIELDYAGNVVFYGYFFSDSIAFESHVVNLWPLGPGNSNFYLVKMDPDGSVLWAKTSVGIANVLISGLDIDPSNNIYISGDFGSDTLTFAPGIEVTKSGVFSGAYLAKYTSAGSPVWAKSFTASSTVISGKIACNAGAVYLLGTFQSPSLTVGAYTITNSGAGNDVFLAALDPAGNPQWLKGMGGIGQDFGSDMKVNSIGDLIIGGYYYSEKLVVGTDTLDNTGGASGTADLFFTRVTGSGNFVWAKTVGGTDSDYRTRLDLAGTYEIYFTCTFMSTDFSFGLDTYATIGDYDVLVGHLDQSGNILGSETAASNMYDECWNMDVSPAGDVYVAGATTGTMTFGGYTTTMGFYLAKLSSTIGLNQHLVTQTGVLVYPNPSTGMVYIDFGKSNRNRCSVYNVHGKLLRNEMFDAGKSSMDLTTLVAGTYFIQIVSEAGNDTKKISIIR